jgi:hypothetical protein
MDNAVLYLTTKGGESAVKVAWYIRMLNALTEIMASYIFPTIVVCGCLSNILILIVMSKTQYRNVVTSLNLKCLAVYDMLTLLVFGVVFSKGVWPALNEILGDAFCAPFNFLAYSTTELSNWTIVLMTFTRFVAVVLPLKARTLLTFRAAKLEMAGIVLFFVGFASPNLFVQRYTWWEADGRYICDFITGRDFIQTYLLTYTTIGLLTPFLLVLILNALIVFSLNNRGVAKRAIHSKRESSEERTVSAMATIVTIAYLMLVFPYMVHVVVWEFGMKGVKMTIAIAGIRRFTFYLVGLLFSTNTSINFYLYVISCKRFRLDVRGLLLCEFTLDGQKNKIYGR